MTYYAQLNSTNDEIIGYYSEGDTLEGVVITTSMTPAELVAVSLYNIVDNPVQPDILSEVSLTYLSIDEPNRVVTVLQSFVAKTGLSLSTALKFTRGENVKNIQVTTLAGNTFDGDEISQNRMARAIVSSNVGDTTTWILANNTPTTISHNELKEALRLAGEAQTAAWVNI